MLNILGYEPHELKEFLASKSQPAFRVKQLQKWLFEKNVADWQDMKNIPASFREILAESFYLRSSEIAKVNNCSDGTVKLLLKFPDGALTETVLMPTGKRNTVCISSQIGCPVKCRFCASGQGGLERSLSAGEMIEQVLRCQEQLPPGERVSNVVVMGMGEPFANYDETIKAARIINADWGLAIGARHITVSTIGLPDKIRKFADEPMQLTLALSLHACTDSQRGDLIPWAKNYPLSEIFDSLREYYDKTHREVTLEYVMLSGVNTSEEAAKKLAKLARQVRCNVNLINYNAVEGTGFTPVSDKKVGKFMEQLTALGVNVHIRRSRGQEIDAACGQLRKRNS